MEMENAGNAENDHRDGPPLAGSPENAAISADQDFRADLNHKLRTPLNAIIGFAELLTLQPAYKRNEDDLRQILKSAREMLVIIEQELAKPEDKGQTHPMSGTSSATHCHVLYIEDDMVNFTLVERILEYRPGLRLTHAPTGAKGLGLAAAQSPKMVLLDLNLPDMHGSEVLQRLQQNPATASIPVVVLSANATPSLIERLLTAGARNYLTKPFDIDPFLAVVDEFVVLPRDPLAHKLIVLEDA
jgi:CheY-like chemotaxis protein